MCISGHRGPQISSTQLRSAARRSLGAMSSCVWGHRTRDVSSGIRGPFDTARLIVGLCDRDKPMARRAAHHASCVRLRTALIWHALSPTGRRQVLLFMFTDEAAGLLADRHPPRSRFDPESLLSAGEESVDAVPPSQPNRPGHAGGPSTHPVTRGRRPGGRGGPGSHRRRDAARPATSNLLCCTHRSPPP